VVKTNKPANKSNNSPSSVDPSASTTKTPAEELKLNLENQKLRYELGIGKWIEVAKSLSGVATMLGILVTLGLGIMQIRLTQTSRDDERFERSVSRLGSLQPSERLTGIAGIEQFLAL
jgi:hypothetical protein